MKTPALVGTSAVHATVSPAPWCCVQPAPVSVFSGEEQGWGPMFMPPAAVGELVGVSIVRLAAPRADGVVAEGDFRIKDPLRGVTIGEIGLTVREDVAARATDRVFGGDLPQV